MDIWLYFLNNGQGLDFEQLPPSLSIPEMTQVREILQMLSQDEREYWRYFDREQARMDELSLRRYHEKMEQRLTQEAQNLEKQSKELKQHSREIQDKSKELQEQSKGLQEQSRELQEQSKELQEQSKGLQEQSRELEKREHEIQLRESELSAADESRVTESIADIRLFQSILKLPITSEKELRDLLSNDLTELAGRLRQQILSRDE